jgi:hypothetical protein
MIAFTQYLRPDGRPIEGGFHRLPAVEAAADELVRCGVRFEAEVLVDGSVSLTAGAGDDCLAIEVVPNGPGVGEAVDRLIATATTRRAGVSRRG